MQAENTLRTGLSHSAFRLLQQERQEQLPRESARLQLGPLRQALAMVVCPLPAKARQCVQPRHDLRMGVKSPAAIGANEDGKTSHFFIVAESKEHSSPRTKFPIFQEGSGLHHRSQCVLDVKAASPIRMAVSDATLTSSYDKYKGTIEGNRNHL